MNENNSKTELKTFISFTLKSGSKQKSINSYINKICSSLNSYEKIEIKAHGKKFYYI
jgi:hypothetical protein